MVDYDRLPNDSRYFSRTLYDACGMTCNWMAKPNGLSTDTCEPFANWPTIANAHPIKSPNSN